MFINDDIPTRLSKSLVDITGPDQINYRPVQHSLQKCVALLQSLLIFLFGEQLQGYRSGQHLLDWHQDRIDVLKWGVIRDNQEVDIAIRGVRALGDLAVDKRSSRQLGQRLECRTYGVGQTNCLLDDSTELIK